MGLKPSIVHASGVRKTYVGGKQQRRIGSAGNGSEASQGDKKNGVMVFYGPLRCSDVPLYDSVVDSHAHGLSFPLPSWS